MEVIMQDKTNVMRLLDSKKVWYRALYYSNSVSGIDVARAGNITMIGFVRDNRFTVYTSPERVNLDR
jgi:hypothetical protein